MDSLICTKCKKTIVITKTKSDHARGQLLKWDKNDRIFCGRICPQCSNQIQRDRRLKNGNKVTHKYEKTVKGFLMRLYRNMLSRVKGIQKKKAHLYLGKPILDKKEFYDWALKSDKFAKLFKLWEISNYNRKLCPTVNRIDPKKGYEIKNMEWITHSENSRLGSTASHEKNKQQCYNKFNGNSARNFRYASSVPTSKND